MPDKGGHEKGRSTTVLTSN